MKKIAIAIIIMVFSGVSACWCAAIFDPETAITEAGTLVEKGDLDGALDVLLFSLLKADTDQAWRVRLERSRILAQKGDALGALGEMDLAIESSPEKECVIVERAKLYNALGEEGLTSMDVNRAYDEGCAGEEVSVLKARLMLSEGDIFSAAETYAELLDSEDFLPEALGSLGLIYSMAGYPETAQQYYKIALKSLPDSPGLLSETADALTLTGDFDEALRDYKKSYELDPDNKISANNYGYTLMLVGKSDEAIEIFNDINAKNPSPYSLCNMLEISIAHEEWQSAMKYGQLCIKAFGENQALLENEKFYIGAVGRALGTIQRDLLSVHPLTQIDLAVQHLEYGERTDALAAYLFALMIDPENAKATFEAGRMFMMMGHLSRGASYLNLAVSLSGGDPEMQRQARHIINIETMGRIDNKWRYGAGTE